MAKGPPAAFDRAGRDVVLRGQKVAIVAAEFLPPRELLDLDRHRSAALLLLLADGVFARSLRLGVVAGDPAQPVVGVAQEDRLGGITETILHPGAFAALAQGEAKSGRLVAGQLDAAEDGYLPRPVGERGGAQPAVGQVRPGPVAAGLRVGGRLAGVVHQAPDDARALADRIEQLPAKCADDLLLAGVVTDVVE